MTIKKSLISVILPVYNQEKYLAECLESILRQTYKNLEIIAVNDSSTDNSLNILKKFRKKNKNIQIIHNIKHYGQAVCLNRAIRASRGQFISFANPSDYFSRDKFKLQIKYLNFNSKIVAVGSQYQTISSTGRRINKSSLPLDHEEIYPLLLSSLPLKPETILLNRMLLPKDILCFASSKYPLMFTDLFIKLYQYGKIANISETLYFHRAGIKRRSAKTSKIKQTFSLLQLLLKYRAIYDYRLRFSASLPLLKSILRLQYH